jgi:hypothetical protein
LKLILKFLDNLKLPITVPGKSKGSLSEEAYDIALDVYSILEDSSRDHADFILEG